MERGAVKLRRTLGVAAVLLAAFTALAALVASRAAPLSCVAHTRWHAAELAFRVVIGEASAYCSKRSGTNGTMWLGVTTNCRLLPCDRLWDVEPHPDYRLVFWAQDRKRYAEFYQGLDHCLATPGHVVGRQRTESVEGSMSIDVVRCDDLLVADYIWVEYEPRRCLRGDSHPDCLTPSAAPRAPP